MHSLAQVEPLRKAPEISGQVWFNAENYPAISIKLLRGRVILLFFWTFEDSSCRKAIGYFNYWYEKYKNRGFEIIGVHASEWGFQVSEASVHNAVRELEIKFPVVMDMDSSIWLAYKLSAWPSFYFIDRKGYIRGAFRSELAWKDAELLLNMLLDEGESNFLTYPEK